MLFKKYNNGESQYTHKHSVTTRAGYFVSVIVVQKFGSVLLLMKTQRSS